jgi:hypothetical protein
LAMTYVSWRWATTEGRPYGRGQIGRIAVIHSRQCTDTFDANQF